MKGEEDVMFDAGKVKLGIAPIAWTNDDLPELGGDNTFEQCISEMALAGFTGSEVGNKYPRDPDVLRPALEMRRLEICSAWFSAYLITRPYEETEKAFREQAAFLARMGAKMIGVSEQSYSTQGIQSQPVFEGKYCMDAKEWDLLCSGLNKLGAIAKETYGITLVFHHHMGTVIQSDAETERLMAETDPAYVSLLYDSGHFAYCGEDPAAMAEKYAYRIKHVHLKDIRPDVVRRVKKERMSFLDGVRAGTFTVPGDGAIEFGKIFRILDENRYEGYMVVEAEQDPERANPLEYALKARTFIAQETGL